MMQKVILYSNILNICLVVTCSYLVITYAITGNIQSLIIQFILAVCNLWMMCNRNELFSELVEKWKLKKK